LHHIFGSILASVGVFSGPNKVFNFALQREHSAYSTTRCSLRGATQSIVFASQKAISSSTNPLLQKISLLSADWAGTFGD